MKFIINDCYGGFSLSDFAVDALGLDSPWGQIERYNPALIDLFNRYGSERISGTCAELYMVEIPDAATDWRVMEYDGSEEVLYVLDGKMHFAQPVY